MNKAFLRGVSVVEVIIAIALFSVLATVGYQVYNTSSLLTDNVGQKTRAYLIAEGGIEALRSIRDANFTGLTAGTHGLSRASGVWALSGTSDTQNGFQRAVQIASQGTDTMIATSTVTWTFRGRAQSVDATAVLTNWRKVAASMATALSVQTENANLSLLNKRKLLTGITLANNGAAPSLRITQVQVDWSNTGNNRELIAVRSPNGTVLWSGAVVSGVAVTLTTPIDLAGASTKSFELLFDKNMNGGTFDITYILSDGSTKVVTITDPPTGL